MSTAIQNTERFRIAVLEDSPMYNLLLKNQLEDYFGNLGAVTGCIFSIKSFTGTKEFLEELDPQTDMVLMDFYLDKGETALTVIDAVKKKCPRCEIIIISAEKSVTELNKRFWMDTVDFIHKDSSAPLRVCRAIEFVYSQKLGQDQNTYNYALFLKLPRNSQERLMKKYDLKLLKEQCGNDSHFFNEMLSELIHSSKEELLHMEEAYKKNDLKELAYSAHKIMAPFKHIQANGVCELLKELEVNSYKDNLPEEKAEYLLKEIKTKVFELAEDLETEYL
jgi:CheY-like chemotaxis protein